jgi:hypothetical protein
VHNCTDNVFRCLYRDFINGVGRMAGTGSRAGPSSFHLHAVSVPRIPQQASFCPAPPSPSLLQNLFMFCGGTSPAQISPTCLCGNESGVGAPRTAATARPPRFMIPTATVGCSRRSRLDCPGASTQRQRLSHRRQMRTGPILPKPVRPRAYSAASSGFITTYK